MRRIKFDSATGRTTGALNNAKERSWYDVRDKGRRGRGVALLIWNRDAFAMQIKSNHSAVHCRSVSHLNINCLIIKIAGWFMSSRRLTSSLYVTFDVAFLSPNSKYCPSYYIGHSFPPNRKLPTFDYTFPCGFAEYLHRFFFRERRKKRNAYRLGLWPRTNVNILALCTRYSIVHWVTVIALIPTRNH